MHIPFSRGLTILVKKGYFIKRTAFDIYASYLLFYWRGGDVLTEKTQPSVTVLIPVYNGEEHIGDCLDSLLNQSYDNYQILVVNDGSRYKTLEKLQ